MTARTAREEAGGRRKPGGPILDGKREKSRGFPSRSNDEKKKAGGGASPRKRAPSARKRKVGTTAHVAEEQLPKKEKAEKGGALELQRPPKSRKGERPQAVQEDGRCNSSRTNATKTGP